MKQRGVLAVVGALVAGLLLATAGAGLAMQLNKEDGVLRIAARPFNPDKVKLNKVKRSVVPNFAAIQDRKVLRRAVHKYLRSKGVDPTGFVIQRGKRNYAGPKCPSKAWNCTTSRKVVQIWTGSRSNAARTLHHGATQQFVCKPVSARQAGTTSARPNPTCILVQDAGTGSTKVHQNAECKIIDIETPRYQKCWITQTNNTGGTNTAAITMSITDDDGADQDGTQDAKLTQQAKGNGNNLGYVNISMELETSQLSTLKEQHQDGHQWLVLRQTVLPNGTTPASGSNAAYISESQDFDEIAPALSVPTFQFQDTDPVADPCTRANDNDPFATACVDYLQDLGVDGTGKNWFILDQFLEFEQLRKGNPGASQQHIGCPVKNCGFEEAGNGPGQGQITGPSGFNFSDKDQDGDITLLPNVTNFPLFVQDFDPPYKNGGMQIGSTSDSLTARQTVIVRAGPTATLAHINDIFDSSTGTVDTRSKIELRSGTDVDTSDVTCTGTGASCIYTQDCVNNTDGDLPDSCFPSGAIPPTTTGTSF